LDLKIAKLLEQVRDFANTDLADLGLWTFLAMMLVSLLTSLFISALYLHFYGSRATGSQIHRSFPLLGLAITAIFVGIQFSLPLSLGLLGALSIVRFRTPIKEPEEIGFIMVVIASSIMIATFNLDFLGIMLFVSVLALLALAYGPKWIQRELHDGIIVLTTPTSELSSRLSGLVDLLDQHLVDGRLDSISKSEEDSIISYSFRGIEKQSAAELQDIVDNYLTLKDWSIYFSGRSSL